MWVRLRGAWGPSVGSPLPGWDWDRQLPGLSSAPLQLPDRQARTLADGLLCRREAQELELPPLESRGTACFLAAVPPPISILISSVHLIDLENNVFLV